MLKESRFGEREIAIFLFRNLLDLHSDIVVVVAVSTAIFINCNRVELVNGNDCITFVGFEFRLIENLAAANELSGCVNYFLTCRKSKFVFLKLHFYNALVMRGKANKRENRMGFFFFIFQSNTKRWQNCTLN